MDIFVMRIGWSVSSDFSTHLAVIRSFSYGSNFPSGYPHFADGNMRYHFMFMFLAGNLEFLGLRLDWAFNLPSILKNYRSCDGNIVLFQKFLCFLYFYHGKTFDKRSFERIKKFKSWM